MPVEMQRAMRPSTGGTAAGLSSVTIDFADNGGVVVRCMPKMKPGKDGVIGYQEPQQHVFSSLKEGLAYVEQKAGGQAESEPPMPEAKGSEPLNPSADEDLPELDDEYSE